jgi:transcriptional regulator with XRE-family HTH domain
MAGNRLTGRRFFAKQLKRARFAKGITQDELAKAVFKSPSLVAMWETGRRLPQQEDMTRVEEALGTGGYLSELLDFVVEQLPLEWLGRWLDVEKAATSLLWFEPLIIPGLLQTEDYAYAVLRSGRHVSADVDDMVRLRMDRQRVLTGEDPPILVALMDESVLRRNVGGTKVMRDQLLHLAQMAERENVIIQIIPLTATACAGFISHFVLAKLDSGAEVAYVDNQLNGATVEQPDEVTSLRRMFELFRADALNQEESAELIQRTVGQWQE